MSAHRGCCHDDNKLIVHHHCSVGSSNSGINSVYDDHIDDGDNNVYDDSYAKDISV